MIPVELLTMVTGAGVGGVLKLWAQNQQAQHDAMQMAIAAHASNLEATKQAGDRAKKDKSANFAKRLIVFASVFCVTAPVWAPILSIMMGRMISVVFGYTEFHPGFLFFPDKEVMVWKEFISGDPRSTVKIIITPAMSQAFSAIIGYYLGYSVAKR